MTVSPWGDVIKVDGLTIADELVVLHTYPRAKGDHSLANVATSAAVGVLADLMIAGRVGMREVDSKELGWWRRRSGHEGAHRFRLSVENATPLNEESLDSVLQRLPGMQSHDLPWCINHMGKMWKDILGRLYDRRFMLRSDKQGNPGGVNPRVEECIKDRIKQTLLGRGAPDDHTAAVVLLAHSAELFKTGSPERELVGPVDDAVIAKQIAKLAALPSLVQVQVVAQASVQVRKERQSSNENAETVMVWNS